MRRREQENSGSKKIEMSSSEKESSDGKDLPIEQSAADLSVDATLTTEATLKAGVQSPTGIEKKVSGKKKKKYEDDSSVDEDELEEEGGGSGSDGEKRPGRTVVGRSTVGVKTGSPSDEVKQKQQKRKVTTNTTVSAFVMNASNLYHGVLERSCGSIECKVSIQSGEEVIEGLTKTVVGEELKGKDKEGGRHVVKFGNAEGKDGGKEERDGGEKNISKFQ